MNKVINIKVSQLILFGLAILSFYAGFCLLIDVNKPRPYSDSIGGLIELLLGYGALILGGVFGIICLYNKKKKKSK